MSDDRNSADGAGGRGGEGASHGPPSAREVLASIHAEPERAEETPPPAATRRFRAADGEWVARVGGAVAYGTGTTGTAPLVSILFARAESPEQPVRESLLPRGRFAGCYDEELEALLREARSIPGSGA